MPLTAALRDSRVGVATRRCEGAGSTRPHLYVVRRLGDVALQRGEATYSVYRVALTTGLMTYEPVIGTAGLAAQAMLVGIGLNDGWRPATRKPFAYLTNGRRARIW